MSKAPRSWGHAVRPMNAKESAQDDAILAGPDEETIGSHVYHRHHWTHCRCRDGRSERPGACHERRAFAVSYSYITGRAGRASRSERFACRAHAEAFARKNSVPMPAEADR